MQGSGGEKMRAVLMEAKGLLKVGQIPKPVPGPGEATVKIERCGICGSDLVTLKSNRVSELPWVLGHEFVGRLHEIAGKKDYPFKEGDLVVAEPISGCGVCRNCRNGEYNVCHKRVILGVQTYGVFAEFARVPVHNLLKVPDGVPLEEAALVQPLAVGLHAIRRSAFQAGCNAAILGAGPIGALLALTARASGATTVILTETNPYRKALMEEIGFPVIDPAKDDPISTAMSFLREGEGGFDVVFDAAGGANTAYQATRMVRVRGEVVLVAGYREEPQLGILEARKREVNYITSRAHTLDDFRAGLALIANRQVDVRPLITKEIGLGEIPEAFRLLEKGGPLMKVLGQP